MRDDSLAQCFINGFSCGDDAISQIGNAPRYTLVRTKYLFEVTDLLFRRILAVQTRHVDFIMLVFATLMRGLSRRCLTMRLAHSSLGTLPEVMLEMKDGKQQSKTKGKNVDRANSQSFA